jgi:hypothetical protein
MNEARTRQAYEGLLRRRALEKSTAPVSLDVVRELAESPTIGDHRLDLLEQILAHPTSRDEFYILRELALEQPRSLRSWIPAGVAAAAMLVVAAGLAVIIRAGVTPQTQAEPMRGATAGVSLSSPAENAVLAPGETLSWNRVNNALSYTVELLDADGEPFLRAETTDTKVIVPPTVAGKKGPYTWTVQAKLADGTTARSAPRVLTAR